MAPILRRVYRHYYLVSGAGRNLLITPRAAVPFICLIRLNMAYLNRAKITQGQNSRGVVLR